MKHSRGLPAVFLSVLCCGCASAPVRYYTLVRPVAASRSSAAAACCNVQVRRVIIPLQDDRSELVLRRGDNQAVVLDNDLWLAPLRDEIGGALSSEINVILSAAVGEGAATDQMAVISVSVTRFDAISAGHVAITATWRIETPSRHGTVVLTCAATAQIAVANGVPSLVRGYQQALGSLADSMALDVLETERVTTPHCSTAPNR